jgi:hypothetical protein
MQIVQLYSGQDTCSGDFVYRLQQPALGLSQISGCIVENHDLLALQDPGALMFPDILILHHLTDPDLLPVIAERKKRGKVTIFELADNFYASQRDCDDPARPQRTEYHYIMEQMLRLCDAVQTTSPALRDRFRQFNGRFFVFPNYVDEIIPWRPPRDRSKPFVVGWGGSSRHFTDLQHYAEGIVKWVQATPDAVLAIMGSGRLAGLFREIPRRQFRFQAGGSLQDYLAFVANIDVGIAPLLPTAFNACRSDVKYLEYASRAVCPLCSGFGPYTAIGGDGERVLLFTSIEELLMRLTQLKSEPHYRGSIARAALQWVKTNRLNRQEIWQERAEIYASLLAGQSHAPSQASQTGQSTSWSQEVSRLLAAAISCDKTSQGLALLADAQSMSPQNYQVHFFRGWLESRHRQYDRAVVSLSKALHLRPDSIRTLQLLAQVQVLRMDIDAAWQTLQRLAALEPGLPSVRRVTEAIVRLRAYNQKASTT